VPPAREGHRRKFSEADKCRIVEEAVHPGASLSEVARRYGIAARVVFRWKQELTQVAPLFVAVEIADAPRPPRSTHHHAASSGRECRVSEMSKCREVAGCIRTRRGEDAGHGRRGLSWVALISPNDFVCPEIGSKTSLVHRAIMSSRRQSRARKIWIDDALGGATRCRRVALRQRRVAAFVIVGPPAVHMQTNWISRIVRLSPSRCRCQNRRDRQHRQSRPAKTPRSSGRRHCRNGFHGPTFPLGKD
jgi:Transposase